MQMHCLKTNYIYIHLQNIFLNQVLISTKISSLITNIFKQVSFKENHKSNSLFLKFLSAMKRNNYLIFETIFIFLFISWIAIYVKNATLTTWWKAFIYFPILAFQGLWFYRFYIVGHEASHKKLIPENITTNDFWGTVILLPLLTPINIYRKIHYFHHGFNRKDHHTSALDTFVIKGKYKKLKTIYSYALWYLAVFGGGFFLHSFMSVVLFLFIPPKLSIRISPAFKGWTWEDQIKAIALFLLALSCHIALYYWGGKEIYLTVLGYPLLAFAWWLSLLVYIFHYDTTKGDHVRYNVRSVRHVPIFSWILMNFNEHATHHQFPNIPWYELPSKRKELPLKFDEANQKTNNFFKAILQQLKGPVIVYE